MLRTARVLAVMMAAALLAAGCSLEDQATPSLTGPSGFALSVALTATPDQVPRDGRSTATVTVTVRDAAGSLVAGQLLSVSSSVGRVSQTQVTTGSNGQATFEFTAPAASTVGAAAVISVVPVGNDANSAVPRSISIMLTGTANSTAPTFADPPFTFTPTDPDRNASIRFDASTVRDEGAPCLDACTYLWSMGDGTSRVGRVINHAFSSAGTFNVTLTVTDAAGASASAARPVSVATVANPTVTLNVSPNPPLAGQTATFVATATAAAGHSISRYVWDFGDGTSETTTGPTVNKTYSQTGTYVARVTVTDDVGQTSAAAMAFTITSSGNTATFTFSPTAPLPGQAVHFDASSSTASGGATITGYAWNFGDGTTATSSDPTVSHTYSVEGTYRVTVTITDSNGRTGRSAPQDVTVGEPEEEEEEDPTP